jgi:hypothetical protein
MSNAKAVEPFVRPLCCLILGDASDAKGDYDVSKDRAVEEQGLLKDYRHSTPQRQHIAIHRSNTIESYGAGGGGLEEREGEEQTGFPCPVGSHKGQNFTLVKCEPFKVENLFPCPTQGQVFSYQ